MKLVRMKAGRGDVLLAEGDPALAEDEERLIAEFRRQLELGMTAAVPTERAGRREAVIVRDFTEIPVGAEKVIFFPPVAGGLTVAVDPAEAHARDSLLEVVGPLDYEIYERFGFLAVAGANRRYSYLVYPYRPLVAYETESGELLSEFCIRYEDDGERLPPADDVLARWMALRGAERELIAESNLNPPGRQVDPDQARRDIARVRAFSAAIA